MFLVIEKVPGCSILERASYHKDPTHLDMLQACVVNNTFTLTTVYFSNKKKHISVCFIQVTDMYSLFSA